MTKPNYVVRHENLSREVYEGIYHDFTEMGGEVKITPDFHYITFGSPERHARADPTARTIELTDKLVNMKFGTLVELSLNAHKAKEAKKQ